MKEYLANMGVIALLGFLVLVIFGVVRWYVSIPDVYFSWTDRECVRVIDSRGNPQPCEPLPERYNRVWVR